MPATSTATLRSQWSLPRWYSRAFVFCSFGDFWPAYGTGVLYEILRVFASKEPSFIPVTCKNNFDEPIEMELPVLLPHKILEHLLLKCELALEDGLVQKYWENLEKSGEESALKSKEYRQVVGEQVWPVGIHGDEASMSIQNAPFDKIWGVFLSVVLFRPKATRTSRFLMFAVESSRVLDVQSTIYPLLEAVKNSLNFACEIGVGGRRFLLSELRGDQAWF